MGHRISSTASPDSLNSRPLSVALGVGLSVGIGCRRGASAEQILAAVRVALGAYPLNAIRCVATLESKVQEPGLREFCARHTLPLYGFSRDDMARVSALTTPSAAARAHLGVDGVCEPCALLAAKGGSLIVPKTILDGVTVAIALVADPHDEAHAFSTQEPSPQNRP